MIPTQLFTLLQYATLHYQTLTWIKRYDRYCWNNFYLSYHYSKITIYLSINHTITQTQYHKSTNHPNKCKSIKHINHQSFSIDQ